jgi:hypothetical protein
MKVSIRLFQFSLRSLFVLVTLVAIFCGYQMNWIRHRHEFLKRAGVQVHVNDDVPAPRGLWLFGEKGVLWITFEHETSESKSEAERLFPEADLEGRLTGPVQIENGEDNVLILGPRNSPDVVRVEKIIKSIEDGNPPVSPPAAKEPAVP